MKRMNLIVLVALVVSLFGASAAFAQDPPADNAPAAEAPREGRDSNRDGRGNRGNGFSEVIIEALDIEEDAYREALDAADEDATLADVITELGGDVDDITELLVAEIVENGAEEDDAAERVDEILNTPRSERNQDRDGNRDRDGRRGNRSNAVYGIINEALELEEDALRDAIDAADEDATLADVITELGGDADMIAELIVDHLVEDGASAEDAGERAEELLNTPKSERNQDRDGNRDRGDRPAPDATEEAPESEGDA